MVFCGISKRFSTVDNIQYKEIGEFWDFFETFFNAENLLGLGLNWQQNSLEYVIGDCDGNLNFDMYAILQKYPDAEYKEIVLPDDGWQTYSGQTDKLSELYDIIYKNGALAYEIESFCNDGSCKVKILR